MKKLSELSGDTMLTVRDSHYSTDFSIMDKDEFLQSHYFLDYTPSPTNNGIEVTVADITTAKFDLLNYLEYIGEDECYEGWCDDVYDSIMAEPATKEFIERVNAIFGSHPTYWEGEPVEIDIFPEKLSN